MAGKRGLIIGLGVAAALVLLLVVLAMGGAVAWLRLGGASGPFVAPYRPAVALDGEHAMFVRQGFEGDGATPFSLRSDRLAGGTLEPAWTWAHPGQGLDAWTAEGPWVAAKLVFNGRGLEGPAFAFHRERGLAWETTQAAEVTLLDRDELLVRAGGSLTLVRLGETPSRAAWTAPAPAGAYVGFYGTTDRHVLLFNDGVGLHIVDRAGGGVPAVVADVQTFVGLSRARSEALVLRGGQLAIVGMDGKSQRTIDLADGKQLADTMEDPCLLGRHGEDWIIVYATTLDEIVGTTFTRPADRTLAAVNAETGEVRWRLPVGSWSLECSVTGDLPLDLDLESHLLVAGARSRSSGVELDGMIAYVNLEKGAFVWKQSFEGIARRPFLLHRAGSAAWVHLVDGNHPVVARFEAGKLRGAIRLPEVTFVSPELIAGDAAWLSVHRGEATHWLRVAGDDLTQTASDGPPSTEDARAWALDRMGLPEPAR